MPERYESSGSTVAPLAEPLHFAFSGKTAPNRFLKAAMTERLSSWSPTSHADRGIPSANLINLYKRWGEGNIGMILSGNILIDYINLEVPGNAIIAIASQPIPGDKRFEAFKELASATKAHGSLLIGQLNHPGRQCELRLQPDPVSASDVQLENSAMGLKFAKPHAASKEELQDIIANFAHAAEYLDKAGWDGIELHAAHGYLLAQFLSETTNQRQDEYGGSIENRARLILESIRAIRKVVNPSFVLGIKLNSVEFQEKGFRPEEARQLCQLLEEEKLDFVELSGGTYQTLAFHHERESSKKREAFFMEFADAIVPGLKHTKSYVTGGFKTVGAMVEARRTIDGIGLGRPLAQEPQLCRYMLSGKIDGAMKQSFDQENFGLTVVVAGSQIRQIGKGQTPFDGSVSDNVDAFMKDMNNWMEKNAKDADMNLYGFVDVENIPQIPYATAIAT